MENVHDMVRGLLTADPPASSTRKYQSMDDYFPKAKIDLDSNALNKFLFPDHRDLRARALHFLEEPIMKPVQNMTVRQHRDLTDARIRHVAEKGFLTGTVAEGTSVGIRCFDAVIDVLALADASLTVKLGVHCRLFAATVSALGTPAQRASWLPRIERLDEFGCFALTELGHGSDACGIETVATYDPRADGFELHTPSERAQKYWIGGAVECATFAAVFAQLFVRSACHGVHVFVVRIRHADGSPVPGVRVADCGAKAGLNGVDNGRLWFTRLSLPRDALLARMSQVAPDGTFSSAVPDDARFSALLAALTGGRVDIAVSAVSTVLLALSIAVRYSRKRAACAAAPGRPEAPLLFQRTHQRTLMVPLATALVYNSCARDLRESWYAAMDRRKVSKELHVRSSGYKALFSAWMADALQSARETCGIQGYMSENRIAPLRAERDALLTFEGANGVMLQQIARVLLAEVRKARAHGGRFDSSGSLAHLNEVPPPRGAAAAPDGMLFQQTFWRWERARVQALSTAFATAMEHRKGDAFFALNDCSGEAEAAARAHMTGRIYRVHRRHVCGAKSAGRGVAEVVSLSGTLWAASTIGKDTDMLRLACISKENANVIDGHIDRLCEQMTGVAPAVIDGIGFPDVLLAPIAGDFIAHNSRANL